MKSRLSLTRSLEFIIIVLLLSLIIIIVLDLLCEYLIRVVMILTILSVNVKIIHTDWQVVLSQLDVVEI